MAELHLQPSHVLRRKLHKILELCHIVRVVGCVDQIVEHRLVIKVEYMWRACEGVGVARGMAARAGVASVRDTFQLTNPRIAFT